MTIRLVHVTLPSPVFVWMQHCFDQSCFGWTHSPLLITPLQNTMCNSWISRFHTIQLGVALWEGNCCACEVFEWLGWQDIAVLAAGDGERCEHSMSWGTHCSGRVKPISWSMILRDREKRLGAIEENKHIGTETEFLWGKKTPLETCPLIAELQWHSR